MKKEIIHIVLCFDSGFVMPSGVMMYSVCVNNKEEKIVFHAIIDESVSVVEKRNLTEMIAQFNQKRLEFYEVSSKLTENLPFFHRATITRSTYYRLFLTEILPKTISKVLYIDGDCIVRHSLYSLWNIDLDGFALAAAFDVFEAHIEYYNRLRYPYELGYFNAGVLLINLEYWRSQNLINEYAEYYNNYPDRIKFEDQDVLNVVLKDKKKFFPIKYNFQSFFLNNDYKWDFWKHEAEYIDALRDPVIVHYTSVFKPWNAYIREHHPFSSTFYKYQGQTIWKNMRLEKRSIKLKIKNALADYLRFMKLKKPLNNFFIDIPPID